MRSLLFPCRARGLIQMIRRRMLAVLEDRETLREQRNEVPADGDPNAMAISIARVSQGVLLCFVVLRYCCELTLLELSPVLHRKTFHYASVSCPGA
jgi:hypothetical protein